MLSSIIFPKSLVHKFGRDYLYVHRKKINSFYAFELMIHFLAGEGFLKMHSDILLNLTPAWC